VEGVDRTVVKLWDKKMTPQFSDNVFLHEKRLCLFRSGANDFELMLRFTVQ